jgi:hypothetical protein
MLIEWNENTQDISNRNYFYLICKLLTIIITVINIRYAISTFGLISLTNEKKKLI